MMRTFQMLVQLLVLAQVVVLARVVATVEVLAALLSFLCVRRASAAVAACLALASIGPARGDPALPTVIVVDSSGSMSAALDGTTRLDTARKVLTELLGQWPADAPMGLLAYGHRRSNDCNDIEVLASVGERKPSALASRLALLRARGKTPLSASLERAAALLSEAGGGGSIILVTDGLETCKADPCAVAARLHAADARLNVHVIGFAVKPEEEAQLSCIAGAAGGLYRTAGDAGELLSSLNRVAEVAAAPPAPAAPEPPPAEPLQANPAEPQPVKITQVSFAATAASAGPLVDWPVAWRVTGDGHPFLYEGESRALALELPPGRYGVEARASNAAGRAEFEAAGEAMTVEVPLAAGRLAARAVAYAGGAPLGEADAPRWSLDPLDGQAPAAMPALAQPSLLLAPGRYRLAVEQKGRTAATEVTVTPGHPLDVELSFRLGEIRLAAALAEDAEPLSDWRGLEWRLVAPDGSVAATAANEARPNFLLPAGPYKAELAIAGTTLARDVAVVEARQSDARLIVPTGSRTLSAALAPGADLLDDWRDTAWTAVATEVIGLAPGTALMENQLAANPSLALLPGRWQVKVMSGLATAEREISVTPQSDATVRFDLQAARLDVVAEPAPGKTPALNVVFEVAPRAGDGQAGDTTGLGGHQSTISSILPAGDWKVTATDDQGRRAEQDVTLAAGEERKVTLLLE